MHPQCSTLSTTDQGLFVERFYPKGDAIDPYRACLGLAAAAVSRGARIHERTTARRIRAGKKSVQIATDGGSIVADAVVIATGALPDDLRALRRHFAPRLSYATVTEPMPERNIR